MMVVVDEAMPDPPAFPASACGTAAEHAPARAPAFVKPRRGHRKVPRRHLYIAGSLADGGARAAGDWRSAESVVGDVAEVCRPGVPGISGRWPLVTLSRPGRDELYLSYPDRATAERVKAALADARPSWEVRYATTVEEQREERIEAEEEEKRSAGFVHTGSVPLGALIPGMAVVERFVDEATEAELLRCVDGGDGRAADRPRGDEGDGRGASTSTGIRYGEWNVMKKRRVKHFGHCFSYVNREVEWGERTAPAFPECCARLRRRVAAYAREQSLGEAGPRSELWASLAEKAAAMDQLTVNEYTPKVGLSPHCDSHRSFRDLIVIVSLAGHTIFEFRDGGGGRHALRLDRRSLLFISGEARYGWEHYIPHRREDWVNGRLVPRPPRRVSFTFRERRDRGEGCTGCGFPQLCDGGAPCRSE